MAYRKHVKSNLLFENEGFEEKSKNKNNGWRATMALPFYPIGGGLILQE